MRQELMDILACPMCKASLTLSVTTTDGDEVLTGELTCTGCAERYPIADGIPNLLPPAMRTSMAAEGGSH